MEGARWVPEHSAANSLSQYGITHSSVSSAAASKPISVSETLAVPLTADLSGI